ncbi:hypothetical protein F511_15093 [Dorcoceras hygrometricum]|uniref:Uncharacterized protein n=1 Tax=Dorcoceras hygrometricum TaxID=472368 RepID=A0A2Z7BRE6_9LAMI|nr:hypothetical protein F511_15093 [Dorcoceras hygrometricum]
MEDFHRASGCYSGGGIKKAALEEGHLQEDEVWSVMKTSHQGTESNLDSKTRKKVSHLACAWRLAVAISEKEWEARRRNRPHEYLAGKLASTQIASFSMRGGVGRTVKGRDLSKTRNAVLTKTGFLEGYIVSSN